MVSRAQFARSSLRSDSLSWQAEWGTLRLVRTTVSYLVSPAFLASDLIFRAQTHSPTSFQLSLIPPQTRRRDRRIRDTDPQQAASSPRESWTAQDRFVSF